MRAGILATKLGMSSVFDDQGRRVPVTILRLGRAEVVHAQKRSDGAVTVQMGFDDVAVHRLSKATRGHFAKTKVKPLRRLKEFTLRTDSDIPKPGTGLGIDHFAPGQRVDVSARSIGKGFAGVMKRHNFSGQRATHGVSLSHRAAGSTGQCQDPGRVFKGKKMAGQMGAARATVQNLRVVEVDAGRSLIFVKGGVPGHRGTCVELRDACKKAARDDAPAFTVLGALKAGDDAKAAMPEDGGQSASNKNQGKDDAKPADSDSKPGSGKSEAAG